MSSKKKTLRRLKARLNQTTMLAVTVLGVFSTLTILSDPMKNPDLRPSHTPTHVPIRGVASIDPSQMETKERLRAATVLTMECFEEVNSDFNSWTQQVRIKGSLCHSKDIVSTQIENTKNGYVATVFHMNKEFTTDFIQLTEGTNLLKVTHKLSDGTTLERTLTVTRH